MVVEYAAQHTSDDAVEPHVTVNTVLGELMRYEEILGVVAVSVEGLVIGSAGFPDDDAEFLSVLGSSLVGVAERSTRRIGAGSALGMSIVANDGMVTVRNGGSFALTIVSEQADGALLTVASQEAMTRIAAFLNPI